MSLKWLEWAQQLQARGSNGSMIFHSWSVRLLEYGMGDESLGS